MRRAWFAAAAAALALGCGNAGESRLLGVDAQGVFKGIVYFDLDGNRLPGPGDDSVKNVTVRLVTLNGSDTVASATSNVTGQFRIGTVPVGTYRVRLDTTPLADTAKIVQQDSLQVTILPGDSSSVIIGVSYPHVSIRQARNTALFPAGRKVFIEGIVLNAITTYSDTTVHVQDTSAAIRMTRIPLSGLTPGDTVRVRGTLSARAGQRTIDLVTVNPIAASFLPTAITLTTAQASTAAGGTRDAQQIEVLNAIISDTATVSVSGVPSEKGFLLTVSDGSGSLGVLLDQVSFSAGTLAPFIPGATFDIVGMLVPSITPGIWRLKPRSPSDLQ
jgi:hypothetical protein